MATAPIATNANKPNQVQVENKSELGIAEHNMVLVEKANVPHEANTITVIMPKIPFEVIKLPDDIATLQSNKSNLPFDNTKSPHDATTITVGSSNTQNEVTNLPDESNKAPDETDNLKDKTKIKHICNNHLDHDYKYLKEQGQSAWCKVNARYHKVLCQDCKKMLVHHKGDDDTIKPTAKNPMHVCCNEKEKCTFAICNNCFKIGIN